MLALLQSSWSYRQGGKILFDGMVMFLLVIVLRLMSQAPETWLRPELGAALVVATAMMLFGFYQILNSHQNPNEAGGGPSNASGRNSRQHTARAKVINHSMRTLGLWPWRKAYPVLTVEFLEQDLAEMQRHMDRNGLTARRKVEVRFHSIQERDEYSVGEEVEVLYSTATQVETFFMRLPPHSWDGIQKISAPTT